MAGPRRLGRGRYAAREMATTHITRLRRAWRRVQSSDLGQQVAVRYRTRARPDHVTVHGVELEVDRSWPERLLTGLYLGNYEGPEAHILRSTLRPDDRYFEVGASIGVIMTIACRIVGDKRVTAVEANPSLLPVAQATAARNGFRPTLINAILGDSDEEIPFHVLPEFWESSLIHQPGSHEVSVPGRVFATELARHETTYLMLDIEGAEMELLNGPLPCSVRAVAMEVHPDLVGPKAVQGLLRRLMDQGFVIDTKLSGPQVVYFSRSTATDG